MAIKLDNSTTHTFVVDDYSDLTRIAKSTRNFGDVAYVINEGCVYMLNSSQQWKKSSGGAGIGAVSTGTETVTNEALTNEELDAIISSL